MLFHSYLFLFLFLPLSVLGYYGLLHTGHRRLAQPFLLVMSLWFYAANDLRSVPVLLISIGINFAIGQAIGRRPLRHQKNMLAVLGVICNLLALGVFKYLNFFCGSVFSLIGRDFDPISILLPVGISFFTFQQIAWLLDTRDGKGGDYSLLEYALFVSFFPYVLSGPIAFHNEIIPQLRDPRRMQPRADYLAKGLTALSFGLAKKVLLAETLGSAADWGWSAVSTLNTPAALLTILCYTLQLYFDFSGYSDMASGVALLFHIELPVNFDSPYRSTSITAFWKRWHMTMTRFFTRYLFIPLGGSRVPLTRICINTLIVFLVSGLWHGAAWTFIFWGGLHGLAMILERCRRTAGCRPLPAGLGWVLTFAYVNLCWVFFRAPSFSAAFTMLRRAVLGGFGPLPSGLTDCFQTAEFVVLGRFLPVDSTVYAVLVCLLFVAAALALSIFPKNCSERLRRFRPTAPLCLVCALLFVWSVLSLSGVGSFLYFNF